VPPSSLLCERLRPKTTRKMVCASKMRRLSVLNLIQWMQTQCVLLIQSTMIRTLTTSKNVASATVALLGSNQSGKLLRCRQQPANIQHFVVEGVQKTQRNNIFIGGVFHFRSKCIVNLGGLPSRVASSWRLLFS
jgi:hypothetical protein